MSRKRIVALALVMTIVTLMVKTGFALDSLIVNIDQVTTITNPEDSTDVRALLKFDLPSELDTTKIVTFAELRLRINILTGFEHPIRLRISPLTRAWSPTGNISWSGPWTRPGGDFADTIGCITHANTSGQASIKADISHIINDYIQSRVQNNGIIICQHGKLKRAYSMVHNRLPGVAVAQLAIYYVNLNRN
jgi:hypothetical protein